MPNRETSGPVPLSALRLAASETALRDAGNADPEAGQKLVSFGALAAYGVPYVCVSTTPEATPQRPPQYANALPYTLEAEHIALRGQVGSEVVYGGGTYVVVERRTDEPHYLVFLAPADRIDPHS